MWCLEAQIDASVGKAFTYHHHHERALRTYGIIRQTVFIDSSHRNINCFIYGVFAIYILWWWTFFERKESDRRSTVSRKNSLVTLLDTYARRIHLFCLQWLMPVLWTAKVHKGRGITHVSYTGRLHIINLLRLKAIKQFHFTFKDQIIEYFIKNGQLISGV